MQGPREPRPVRPDPPPATGPVHERHGTADKDLVDGLTVRRALPRRTRRRIGAWCFLDHFGPTADGAAMDVGPHPHIGLATVTWLFSGAIRHLDSLGHDQIIRPGQLNWMTAGRGIAHAEVGQPEGGPLHGVQFWVASPDDHLHDAPSFLHVPVLPTREDDDGTLTVLVGTCDGLTSPAPSLTPLMAAEVGLAGRPRTLALDPSFEHGVLVVSGEATVDGETVAPGSLLYLGRGREALSLDGDRTTRLMLFGGVPLQAPRVLWWNFVAPDWDAIRGARDRWQAGAFPPVPGYDGPPLPAPPAP